MYPRAGAGKGWIAESAQNRPAWRSVFWRSWEHARLAYRAAIHLGQIRPASGDWGLVDLGDVPLVFPGLRLPKAELRTTFAVQLVRETVGAAADFHAISYRPLFWVNV